MSQNARKGRAYFRPGMSPAAGGITVTNPHLKRQDIADWTRAVNAARSALFPRRKQLHDLYDNIVLDAHVQSVLLARTSQVANRQLRWFTKGKPEPEGKEDIYKTVIATPWFHRFIEGAMSAVPYGTTVLELVMKAGEVHDVAVIPRANVAPEQGLVLEDPYQYDKGIPYRDDPYWSRYLIEVGEVKNYGGLLVAAMYVLYKRGGFSNWAQYMEMFGMPLRKGTYNPYDDASRTKLTQALEQMGSASWIVLPEGSNVEFIAASNSSGTGSADLYDKNIERCNAEISKLFLGQTLTTESGDRGARSLGEVHQETKNDIAQADMRRMEFLLNYELRPRLVQLGYPLADGEFHFYEEATMPAKERIVVDAQVARHVPIPDSYWYKTYGIPAPTAAELKAIAERKEAAGILAGKAEGRTKSDPSTEKEEEPAQEDEEDRAFTASLTAELDAYYKLPPSFTAAAGSPKGKGAPQHILDRIALAIRNGEITADSVDPELMQWIADEFTKQLLDGDAIADDSPLSPGEGPGVRELTPEHQRQLQVFSGFKTNAQLRTATNALYDANGAMVPWATFKKRILQIDQAYNVRYLQAEYNLAKANRSAIISWNEAQAMKDVAPFIRYSTVGDERVRKAHADINGVIKHVDDPFWNVWWPPNGWNCRCTVIPVRSDKGGKPVPDDIVPPKTMFANNVGKNGVIFPKGHPYEEQASKLATEAVHQAVAEANSTPSFMDVTVPPLPKELVPTTEAIGPTATSLLSVYVRGKALKTARHVLGLIKKAHGSGGAPAIPLYGPRSYVLYGLYTNAEVDGLKGLRIHVDFSDADAAAHLVHELGHRLDNFIAQGTGFRFASDDPSSVVAGVMKALNATKTVKLLRRVGAYKRNPLRMPDGTAPELDLDDYERVDYWLLSVEMFARAYGQYIAMKTGDAELLKHTFAWNERRRIYQAQCQWPMEEFMPVMREFDKMFIKLKWAKPID